MPRRTPLPGHLDRPFSIDEARRAGVSYGRTRSADLVSPFHGVRAPATRETPDFPERRIIDLAHCYAPRLLPGQFFAESTAIALHGLPLPRSRFHEASVHVGVVRPRTPPRARGVVGHQFTGSSLMSINGLPLTGPVDAWVHCGAGMSVADLVVIGDALVRRVRPLANLDELRTALAQSTGHRGARPLRTALGLVRSGTDSASETLLRLLIVAAGLPEPLVNFPIHGVDGSFLALGDLVYPRAKVVIEYEGGHHFTSQRQLIHDLERHARLTDAGWRVIRAHKGHLSASAALLGRIRAALDA
jgi:hypothetical protein